MEEVQEFKYLGSILCKYGSMDGETRETAVQGRKVVGSLGRIMKGRTVGVEEKKGTAGLSDSTNKLLCK